MASGMTFKKFAIGAIELPAQPLIWIARWLLGYTETDSKGKPKLDKNREEIRHNGLLGFILDGFKALGRGISSFVHGHKQAIATAFWLSLVVGGGLALAFYLSPIFLAKVAAVELFGYSIAAIVGTDALLQMGFAVGLAVGVTSAVTYITAGIVDFIVGIKNCIYPPAESANPSSEKSVHSEEDHNSSPQKMMNRLSGDSLAVNESHEEDVEPANHASPIETQAPVVEEHAAVDAEHSASSSMS